MRRSRFNSQGFGLGQLASKKAERDIEISELKKKLKENPAVSTVKEIAQRLDKTYKETIADFHTERFSEISECLLKELTTEYEEFKQQFAEFL